MSKEETAVRFEYDSKRFSGEDDKLLAAYVKAGDWNLKYRPERMVGLDALDAYTPTPEEVGARLRISYAERKKLGLKLMSVVDAPDSHFEK
jgi:hypothetical protein